MEWQWKEERLVGPRRAAAGRVRQLRSRYALALTAKQALQRECISCSLAVVARGR